MSLLDIVISVVFIILSFVLAKDIIDNKEDD